MMNVTLETVRQSEDVTDVTPAAEWLNRTNGTDGSFDDVYFMQVSTACVPLIRRAITIFVQPQGYPSGFTLWQVIVICAVVIVVMGVIIIGNLYELPL